jgi:HCOMODA/2-hydroxy-3-carboxy-muconic semialdehyde decarboxylase
MSRSEVLAQSLRDLVRANRILAREEVVDAFGHVSVRHPEDPARYLLARSRSPELVTEDDIMTFTLAGEAVGGDTRRPYGERFIHGAAYEKRADVQAVIHNHAPEVIPFGLTGGMIRPLMHVCAPIGASIPIWDIRKKFGDTNLLVTNMDQGRDLMATLGAHSTALMRGHGCVVVARNLREAVMTAIYLKLNARLQEQAMRMGEPQYLSPGEIELCQKLQTTPLALDRAWEYWCARAGFPEG